MKILKEKLITNIEALKILNEESKKGELKFYQNKALDSLRKFYSEYKHEKIAKLENELESLGFLKRSQIVQIINILPKDKNDLLLILGRDLKDLGEEKLNKVFETIKNYF